MAQMTEEMKDVAAKARLFAIATATPEGKPNVVPISFARIISDDEWLLMDNFMEKTEANLKVNWKRADTSSKEMSDLKPLAKTMKKGAAG